MDLKTILIRLFVAYLLGFLIGIERQMDQKPAGIKTHSMVCLGSALTMLLGVYLKENFNTPDATRLAAQVISGIGFLGAGCVMRDGVAISGITTAASIWLVACIGIAVGGGFIVGACVTTGFILFNFLVVGKIEYFMKTKKLDYNTNYDENGYEK